MQYLVTRNVVQVIGYIWMPNNVLCAQEYELRDYDFKQYGIDRDNPTRDQIERWISTNTGDFSSITDWKADIGKDHILDWKDPDSELSFNDCMYPIEE